jgi:ankyrin repeat protein
MIEYLLTFLLPGGQTSLHKASAGGHVSLVNELLRLICMDRIGISIDGAMSNGGATSLHLAAQAGHTHVVRSLLIHGATVDARNEARQTALHKACFEGHTEVVDALLAHGADAKVRDSKGFTCLHCAASGGRHNLVERLTDRSLGIDIDAALASGEDASIMASQNGFNDLASKITRKSYVGLRRAALSGLVAVEPQSL